MNNEHISQVLTFINVVEAGNFTAAAEQLGVSQPTVSRHVKSLEERLGIRLFTRTTRSICPTDEGTQYYKEMLDVLEAMEQATHNASSHKTSVQGRIRVGAPVAFGLAQILPRLPRLMAQWPLLSVDLEFNDSPVDLISSGIDVSIRIGNSVDQSLITRKIGETDRIAIASSVYLQRFGEPQHPDELSGHECIIYTRLPNPRLWQFLCPETGAQKSVQVNGRVHVNTSDANRIAAEGGLGIAIAPKWLLPGDYQSRGLVQILKAYEPMVIPINAVFPTKRHLNARTRAFVDFMVKEFRHDAFEAGGIYRKGTL